MSNEEFTKNTREIYYILVNLLLLSQDQALVSSLASIEQQQVKWIDQIKMNNVSVQSLVIFVLIKVMKQNLEVLNDEYLQNLLNGILFNVSQSQHIHQAVNISFLDFMVALVKKKTKAKEVPQLILDTLANLQKCMHKILGLDQGNLNQFSVDLVYSILNNAEDLKQTDDQYLIELIVHMEKQISLRSEEDVTSILSKEIGQFRCNKVQYNLRFVYEEDEKSSEFSIVPFIWQIYLEFQDDVDEKKIKMFSK